MYSFGLGKRAQHQYSFGLGKRGEGRMYSFGLGKRPNYERMAGSRFNFGLGKRADANPAYLLSDLGEEKRGPDHRFAFGLGKREVSPNELEAVREEQLHHDQEAQQHELAEAAPAPERQPNDAHANGKHAVKRSLHYGFGIGKRTSDAFGLDVEPEEDDRDAISEDFTRYIRRPYSFGLGKRVPMYDFGIGKRADR
ncbi:Allatostatins [Gryllus bimaculatus]|nr:Allatostatins [Gryllus bimaculatus]